jgi:hypothetical protein
MVRCWSGECDESPFPLRSGQAVIAAIQAVGGHILEGPAPAPNGDRLIARHTDGAVFEYIETGDQRQ